MKHICKPAVMLQYMTAYRKSSYCVQIQRSTIPHTVQRIMQSFLKPHNRIHSFIYLFISLRVLAHTPHYIVPCTVLCTSESRLVLFLHLHRDVGAESEAGENDGEVSCVKNRYSPVTALFFVLFSLLQQNQVLCYSVLSELTVPRGG